MTEPVRLEPMTRICEGSGQPFQQDDWEEFGVKRCPWCRFERDTDVMPQHARLDWAAMIDRGDFKQMTGQPPEET